MIDFLLADFMFDAPLDKYVDTAITYQLEDIRFDVTEYGNLQPTCILYNDSTDPDPTTFVQLPNIDVLFKKRLLIGDIVDHDLNLITRPEDASPVPIPRCCKRCGFKLSITHQRKLIIKCLYCQRQKERLNEFPFTESRRNHS